MEGKPFKIGEMEYKNKLEINGRYIPFISRLIISDAKSKDNKSITSCAPPKAENHPDSLFNIN